MFKVKIISIGKTKESWLKQAINEYEKRMSNDVKITWLLLKDDIQLNKHIQKEEKYICLDEKGKQYQNSIELSKDIINVLNTNNFMSFVIGGSDGLNEDIKSKAIKTISLSHLTMTHQICRLIFIEQLYRAFEINKGSKYHK